ncbi:NfeD family protein [Flexivirga oryzae]|uniref:Membrane protein implicated in regulation of membrane protease activity n=1 Tax=Flexivirga oryzae TaxID=1794944 RepID=A0A839NFQ1_9MICO|nr:NfeD family protein [Flexivirga oryzae]MBB2894446.1 membrane protein implicated in regulation of membrane protease activity [Flexivirga oryzae]
MAALIWFAGGVLLAAAEALSGDFVLLMIGGGAIAAGIAMFIGAPLWLATIVFAIVSVGLVFGLRPVLKRHLLSSPTVPTGIEALRGREATVLRAFGNDGGQVRLAGQIWSARPADENDTFRTGESVIVQDIDGATAVVRRGDD